MNSREQLENKMRKGTALKKIDRIKNQLVNKYQLEKIIIFGSAARGDEEINDIDLFIIKNDVPYYGADRITELYRLMDTDLAIDYIIYKPEEVQERLSLRDPFLVKIFNEGIILYG